MGQIYQVGNQYINEKSLENEVQKILEVLRKEKRTYSMNIFLLKETIKFLEKEAEVIANIRTFQ